MTDLKENFIHLREDLELTAEERSAMRTELIFRMNQRAAEVTYPSPYLRYFMQPMIMAGAFVIALLALTGGTSALASGALPGDTLYALKVGVNEKVERSLATTPEEKAVVDIKHAEERLAEVELLAAKGGADEETIADAEAAVEEKVESAVAVAETFSDEGDETKADVIHSRLNAVLLAHADILDAQAEGLDEDHKRGLRALSVSVSLALDTADDNRENTETEADRDVIAAVTLSREEAVGRRLNGLERALRDDGMPEETQSQLDGELARIQADYGDARELSVDGKYREASDAYDLVGRRVSRALAIITSAKRIENETGREVVVAFDGEPVQAQATVMAKNAAPAPESMTMMLAADATTTVEDENAQRLQATERPFQFWVRDRLEGLGLNVTPRERLSIFRIKEKGRTRKSAAFFISAVTMPRSRSPELRNARVLPCPASDSRG